MLPKTSRLPIQDVIRKKPARTLRGRFFLLQFFPREADKSRWGVLVSRGTLKKAVDRNALRRLAFRVVMEERSGIQTGDVLLVAQKAATRTSSREIRAELTELCRNLKNLLNT